jgi:hypothetical protein
MYICMDTGMNLCIRYNIENKILKQASYSPLAYLIFADNDDVYLEYYSGKWFHINYSCLHVLHKTHKLVQ